MVGIGVGSVRESLGGENKACGVDCGAGALGQVRFFPHVAACPTV